MCVLIKKKKKSPQSHFAFPTRKQTYPYIWKKSPAGQEVKHPATFTSVRCVRLFIENWVTKPVSALDLENSQANGKGSHEVYRNTCMETWMGTQTRSGSRMSSLSRIVELTGERKCGERGFKQKQ